MHDDLVADMVSVLACCQCQHLSAQCVACMCVSLARTISD